MESISTQNSILFFYGTIILLPIGVTLNIIQLLVFSCKDFKKNNIGFQMKMLIIADTISLIWSFLVYKFLPLIGYDLALTRLGCVLYIYILRVFLQLPFFYQSFITFINYLNVRFPFEFHQFKKKKNLKVWYFLITFIILLLNIPNLLKRSLKYNYQTINNKTYITSLTCDADYKLSTLASLQSAILKCFLPITFIAILNVLTVKAVILSKIQFNASLNREKKFAYVLAKMGIVLIIFNFPLSIISSVYTIYKYILIYPPESLVMINLDQLYDYGRFLAYSYNGIGFFINLIFNKLFRRNLGNFFDRNKIIKGRSI